MPSEQPVRNRGVLTLTLGCMSVAVAAWLVPASVYVVDWNGDTARRVAMLAPFSRLLVLFLAAGIVVLGLVASLPVTSRRQIGQALAPLSLLLLWVVPFLPILPDHFPLMLALAGPLRWLVAGLALFGCVVVAIREKLLWVPSVPPVLPGPRWIFLLSILIFLAAGTQVHRSNDLGGDEPHYLVITHSLVADGDLRIENNHDAGDYRSFYPIPLPMHILVRGVNDVAYSVHAPGLPLLLAPAYMLAGHRGAIFLLIVFAGLAATAVFSLAARLETPRVALTTWVAVTLTVPFLFQSYMIYPELPASAITAFAMLWLWAPAPNRIQSWLVRGAIIGILPWLHVKFSFLLLGLTISLLAKLWPQRRFAAVALLGPMAVSGVVWLSAYFVMYGTPDPTAPYGTPQDVGAEFIPRGILGLLFDQEFGLLIYSPIYILAFRGCWLMLREERTRWPTIGMTVTLVMFVLSVTQYYMWWGGYSVPARFLVPALPLVAPMIAVALGRLRSSTGIGVTGVLLAASLCSLVTLLLHPSGRLMFNGNDGTSGLVEAWQGSVNLTAVLPSFIDLDWPTQLPWLALWLGASLVGGFITSAAERRGILRLGTFSWGVVWLLTVGVLVSVAAGSTGRTVTMWTAQDGQQALMQSYGSEQVAPYSLNDLTRLTDDEVFSRATVKWPIDEDLPRPEGLIAGPFALPPGQYEVTVQFKSGTQPSGSVWLRYDNGPTAITTQAVSGDEPTIFTVDLPLGLDTVWVGATTAETTDAASAVLIHPLNLVPKTDRRNNLDISSVRQLDGPGRYLFFLDRVTFQEASRWWVRGDETASILLSPNAARQVSVTVRRGAAGGTTTVEIGDQIRTTNMQRRRRWVVTADLSESETLIPIAIGCVGGFRPSEINEQSTDRRYLGCEVTVRLS